jgi:tetratricopeptide (TPR) repeat protein
LVTSAFADAYINLAEYGRAIDYSRRALEAVDPEQRPYAYAIAITNLGIALSKSGSHSQGLGYLEEGRQIFERIQARSEALELQGLVAEAHEESGDYEAALAAYKRFKQSADELHQEQMRSRLAEAQAEFDVTLAQQQRDLLETESELQELVIGRQRLVAGSAIAGLLGTLIILGLGWNRFRVKSRAFEALSKAHQKLDKALEEVRTLQGLLPICSNCKKVRDDQGLWNQIESYISKHSEAQFTHSICPDCARQLYPDFYPGLPEEPQPRSLP